MDAVRYSRAADAAAAAAARTEITLLASNPHPLILHIHALPRDAARNTQKFNTLSWERPVRGENVQMRFTGLQTHRWPFIRVKMTPSGIEQGGFVCLYLQHQFDEARSPAAAPTVWTSAADLLTPADAAPANMPGTE